MAALTSMMNIGKELARKLDSVGIGSEEELACSGAEQAFLKLKERYQLLWEYRKIYFFNLMYLLISWNPQLSQKCIPLSFQGNTSISILFVPRYSIKELKASVP